MEFLGDTFVKADGSSVDLAYVTEAKIIIVMYTAGGLICASVINMITRGVQTTLHLLHKLLTV